LLCLVAACGPSKREGGSGGPCSAGQVHCDGLELQQCVDGSFSDVMACETGCTENIGCTVCTPGEGTCTNNMSHACNDDGSGFIDTVCDPMQGLSCDPNGALCVGECAPQTLGKSYIGCEYYPTVTGNTTGTEFDFAIAIANTTNTDAMVEIEDGALTAPMMITVPANKVTVQILPWVPALKLCNTPQTDGCIDGSMGPGALAAKGAYHVRSSHPVTVYQFNSLEYQKNADFSYSNDASLLLPTNVWRTSYYAAAWQQLAGINPSELAVTATQDNTTVMVNSKADTVAGGGAPAFTAGTPQPVTLNAGDVLEITTRTGDLTGSFISSDKPIEVISGHYCADVPDGVAACDHMEESMFGVDALGKRYMVNAPAVTTIPTGKAEVIRIIATSTNTNLTYTPAQPGAPTTIANSGDFVEISGNASSFLIEADQKVLVAQYMEGQDAGGGTGDPAMALAVPVEQFRTSYLFHAPTSYESNYVDVTATMGGTVMLDGVPLAFTPIGNTGFGFVRVFPLSAGPGNDGNHSITGDQPFGISVYGYGQYTSYWYPGGLNLIDIIN
jgi:hypothetical protein